MEADNVAGVQVVTLLKAPPLRLQWVRLQRQLYAPQRPFFFFQPAAGERGTPAETIPSAAVHDTAVRAAEARPTESAAAETLAAPHPHPKRKPTNHQHPERDYC